MQNYISQKRDFTENPDKISRKTFLTVWFLAFCAMFTTSSILGIVPMADTSAKDAIPHRAFAEIEEEVEAVDPEVPLRISAPAVGVNVPIVNPTTTDINALEAELTKGVVRYPGSGLAGENSNMFIFGHSSQLPVVQNRSYKAFNGIENLKRGEEVVVYGKDREYVYKVVSVEKADANDTWIDFITEGESILTLVTCNVLGEKNDRFIVTAKLSEIR